MAQVVLPYTIDAGTEITAIEHQENYVSLRDTINGQLEGGPTSAGNIKANGITAREFADDILYASSGHVQAGAMEAAAGKATPGALLNLNIAAGNFWVPDNSGVLSAIAGTLLPVNISAGSALIGTAHATLPRIDQIVLRVTGYRTGVTEVLAGTATSGATLDNRTGAAALGNDRIRLADILVPAAFVGPFVAEGVWGVAYHIRDRRAMALPGRWLVVDAPTELTGLSSTHAPAGSCRLRIEVPTNSMLKFMFRQETKNAGTNYNSQTSIRLNGANLSTLQMLNFSNIGGNADWLIGSTTTYVANGTYGASLASINSSYPQILVPVLIDITPGSYVIEPWHSGTSGNMDIRNRRLWATTEPYA